MSYLVDIFGCDDKTALERVNSLVQRLDDEVSLIKSNYSHHNKNPHGSWMMGHIISSYIVNRQAREQAGRVAAMLEKSIAERAHQPSNHAQLFEAARQALEGDHEEHAAPACSADGCTIG